MPEEVTIHIEQPEPAAVPVVSDSAAVAALAVAADAQIREDVEELQEETEESIECLRNENARLSTLTQEQSNQIAELSQKVETLQVSQNITESQLSTLQPEPEPQSTETETTIPVNVEIIEPESVVVDHQEEKPPEPAKKKRYRIL